nr:MAG TPA: hypothetical protein [Caudoviricetes sp.]
MPVRRRAYPPWRLLPAPEGHRPQRRTSCAEV